MDVSTLSPRQLIPGTVGTIAHHPVVIHCSTIILKSFRQKEYAVALSTKFQWTKWFEHERSRGTSV